jgi:hypothetical protein
MRQPRACGTPIQLGEGKEKKIPHQLAQTNQSKSTSEQCRRGNLRHIFGSSIVLASLPRVPPWHNNFTGYLALDCRLEILLLLN